LERFFQKQDANHIEVIMADGLEKSYPIIKKFIVDGYAAAQAYGKWAYEFLYLLNKCYPMTKIHQNILALAIKSHIKDIILQEKPNKIVVFHFLLIKPVQQALKELGLDIPVVTIVTDPFTGTRTRFMEKNMKYIVYSERMKLYAMSL
jgi:UDP-N-acetylglucosamine:LPS N-acetylglucosamine transferase